MTAQTPLRDRTAPTVATPASPQPLEQADHPPRMRRTLLRWGRLLVADLLPPLVAMALVLAGWWLYVEISNEPEYIVPAPDAVIDELTSRPDFYIEEAWFTLKNALAGLAIGSAIALALAAIMAHSRLIEKSLFPIAILVKVTPVVAIAPLFTIWWGFGVEPKIAIAALIAWFPMLVNGITGFRSVEPAALDFMRSINASSAAIFTKLRLPSSLPYLIAGMRVALPLSIIGAVVIPDRRAAADPVVRLERDPLRPRAATPRARQPAGRRDRLADSGPGAADLETCSAAPG